MVAEDTRHLLLSRRYKLWLVAVLLLVSTLNFADRAVLAVLAQPIKEELKLTDTDIGMLQGLAFAILYSILGLPLGWLAERFSRKGLIAICVAAWSMMTVACGFATNFATMLLGRVGVGIGEAGFLPISSSLVADHFRSNRRGSVIAIIMLGAPFGFLLGQASGGWIASEWGWRVAFYALGVPGLLAALIVWLTLREPPRGLVEGFSNPTAAPSFKVVFQTLWSNRSFRHLLLGYVVVSFAMNAVANFVMPFYLRSFGLPIAIAGAAFGAVSFSSNGLGMLLGGFGFDRLAYRDARWPLWGPAGLMILAAPLYLFAFASTQVWVSMGFIWFANLTLAAHTAPTMATMQNLLGPRMRAMSTAIAFLAANLLGAGLGPTVLGMASDLFAGHAFTAGDFIASCPGGRALAGAEAAVDAACQAASAQGLRLALMSVLVFFPWAVVHYVLAARTLKQNLYSQPGAT
jgi:predicted MFS family arabinose efflux permease